MQIPELGDKKDQRSWVHHPSLIALIGATLDSDRAWKFRPAPPFTSFVTISLCLLCWDLSQENPGPFQDGVFTQSQATGMNRHPENTWLVHVCR